MPDKMGRRKGKMDRLASDAVFENKDRPAWMNWLFLGIFLFSSWQLAGYWFQQLHG